MPPHSYKLSYCIFQMDPSSTPYIGFSNIASRFTKNLALATWAIFTPLEFIIHSNGLFIGSTTNNEVEYDVVMGLLVYSLDHHILHLHVCLDSLLLVMQLNGVYHVHNLVLFRKYLWVNIFMHEFESITFNHVPRAQNHYEDTIANNILTWHLSHVKRCP